MKKILNAIFRNPKTTVAGAITLLLTTALHMGYIDMATFVELAGVASGLGFAISKDSNVTGTGV